VLAALGHGRSYGIPSKVLFRTLPGILQSGLWDQLAYLAPVPTRALITDVGNDILYGCSSAEIVAWVRECVERLQRITQDIVITDLPVANIERLSRARFVVFRSMLFPSCRLTLRQVAKATEEVSEGLSALAKARGLHFFSFKPEWYGFDPIHIRPHLWTAAWQEILGGEPAVDERRLALWAEAINLYFTPPERQRIFGFERFTPQSGLHLRRGGRVWLY
jgi:hypothetical protein